MRPAGHSWPSLVHRAFWKFQHSPTPVSAADGKATSAVMDSDTTSAIVEGLAQADPQAIMQKEKEENDRAAAEAAKDLDDDYGESPAGSAAAAAAAEQGDDGD